MFSKGGAKKGPQATKCGRPTKNPTQSSQRTEKKQIRENNQDVRSANGITSETTKEDHHRVQQINTLRPQIMLRSCDGWSAAACLTQTTVTYTTKPGIFDRSVAAACLTQITAKDWWYTVLTYMQLCRQRHLKLLVNVMSIKSKI